MEVPARPSKKEKDRGIKKARESYRVELNKLRKETKTNIPFGANLDLYRKKK